MPVKKRVVISVINDLNSDQRVHKMALFIQKQGYDVLLVGRVKKDSAPMESRPYQTKRFKLIAEKGALFYAVYNWRLFWFLLFQKADILVSNDLDTLLANFVCSKMKGIRLVYDSHEYFTEVPELIHRPRIQRIWEKIEGYIFPKLTTIITVNHSIAEKYKQKYGKDLIVVRNCSPLWKAQNIPSKQALGIPENKFIIIMQGAGLNIDRGVEEAIEAIATIPDVVLLIVGHGDVIPEMEKKVKAAHWDNIFFFGKKPYNELLCYTYHADLGLSLDKPTNPNYLFSLPNKVFDYLHTGTPILASNVVEVAALIQKHDIGQTISEVTTEQIRNAINNMQQKPELLERWKYNCLQAAQVENWEHEVSQLTEIYPTQK